jgi:hypothetical protein
MFTTIGRFATGTVLAALLTIGLAGSTLGQDSVEIRADGPDVTDSAAGADNVRVELNPGRQQAAAGQGVGNQEIRRAPRDDSERQRNDRDRTRAANSGGDAAGGGDAGGSEGGVEAAAPAAAPADAAPAEPQAPAASGNAQAAPRPVQLPSTGSGLVGSLPALGFLLAAGASAASGWAIRRRI